MAACRPFHARAISSAAFAAGVACSASKTALGSLVKSFDTRGGPDGVRACHLCPVTVDRVLSGNGAAYRSHLWHDACEVLSDRARTRRLQDFRDA
ncbi:hypothetical protein GCM10009532_08960 [Microbacterium aurantiacum]